MGERLNGSRQSPKEVFLYLASQEFLAMYAIAQADDTAQLQQEFTNELCRSGKDRNQFGSLDEFRTLVLRDGFRLETGETLDLTSVQAMPELATQRLTIREKSAAEIIRNLKENTPLCLFYENAAELYLGRWTRDPGWVGDSVAVAQQIFRKPLGLQLHGGWLRRSRICQYGSRHLYASPR